MKDEKNVGSVCDLFEISDQRADEIANAFNHAQVDHDEWTAVFKQAVRVAEIKTLGDAYYLGWMLRAKYDKYQTKGMMAEIMKEMLSK